MYYDKNLETTTTDAREEVKKLTSEDRENLINTFLSFPNLIDAIMAINLSDD